MKITCYVHSTKESMWEKGEQIGLQGEALDLFKYALCEVEFVLDVKKDGTYEILSVDGQELKK